MLQFVLAATLTSAASPVRRVHLSVSSNTTRTDVPKDLPAPDPVGIGAKAREALGRCAAAPEATFAVEDPDRQYEDEFASEAASLSNFAIPRRVALAPGVGRPQGGPVDRQPAVEVDLSIAIVVDAVLAGRGFEGPARTGASRVATEVDETIEVVVDAVVANERRVGFSHIRGTGAARVEGIRDAVAVVVDRIVTDECRISFRRVGDVAASGVENIRESVAVVVDSVVTDESGVGFAQITDA